MGMKISDLVALSNQGVTAKDLYNLNKNGYNLEIINELLSVEAPSLEDLQANAEKEAERLNAEAEEKAAAEQAAADKDNLIASLQTEIEDLKNKLETAQANNRGGDMGEDLPDPDESKKNITDYISSKM